MSNGPYAIVVNVPNAEQECFIAIPFSPDFAPVNRLITQAVNAAGLRAVQTNQIQSALTFTEDIASRLRSAEIVVAVCAPEPETGMANPNVMYELGFAQALGKSTVVLTDQREALPGNLDAQYVVPYDRAELQNDVAAQHLILRIKDAIILRQKRMTNPLTDPFATGISVAYARHRMLLAPGFWDDFRYILNFAKQVHEQTQTLDAGYVDALFKSIGDVLFTLGNKRPKIGTFCDRWNEYHTYFIKWTRPTLFDALPQSLESVDQCFQRILADADPDFRKAIQTAYKFFDQVRELLTKYTMRHDALTVAIGSNLPSLLESESSAKSVYGQVQALSTTSKTCVIQADSLIVNLIKIML
jgi:nucleoside 2-deoxyribosyltransferase